MHRPRCRFGTAAAATAGVEFRRPRRRIAGLEYEERLIEAAGFPDLESHRRIHQGFVKWVKDLRDDFTGHRRGRLSGRIMGYLRAWLRDHILGGDQRHRPYIGDPE